MRDSLFKPLLLGAFVLFVGSAQFFVYTTYVSPRAKALNGLQALSDVLQLENQKKPTSLPVENRGVTIPDLLSRVQELAAQNAVVLTGIEPVPADPESFKLNFAADYGSFLEFLAHFETLQVAVVGFDIAPMPENSEQLRISLKFRHTAVPNAIAPGRIKEFEAKLRSAALRDPFNPGAGGIRMIADPDSDDLTWTYRLTSISEIGKTRYATIDGKDYSVGDRMRGLIVSAIGNDNVIFAEAGNGQERQRVLKFRKKPGDRI